MDIVRKKPIVLDGLHRLGHDFITGLAGIVFARVEAGHIAFCVPRLESQQHGQLFNALGNVAFAYAESILP